MKFAHLADCHVGAWREPKLRALTIEAFQHAIQICLDERVDFLLLAGDLFHTAIPSLDGVKAVFKQLNRLKQAQIPVYFITGSHDYSPTGKTMLDIIEEARLGINVFRGAVKDNTLELHWTADAKTGVQLCGILGRANQLDSALYTQIDRFALESHPGEKIFMFHTSLAELQTTSSVIDSAPLSLLPRGCKYYAGGHVHQKIDTVLDERHIVYPGPLFPASFSELEELRSGSFCIVDNWTVKRVLVPTKAVRSVSIDCEGYTPMQVHEKVIASLPEVRDAIVLIRLRGQLAGKPSEISWRQITDALISSGAYVVLRNTYELSSPEIVHSTIAASSIAQIEERVLAEHSIDAAAVRALMSALGSEKQDGERQQTYEERITAAAREALASVSKETVLKKLE